MAERQASGKPFRLVLLDSGMAGTDAIEMVDRMRRLRLEGRIILMTRCGAQPDAERYRAVGIDASLNKPLRQAELLKTVSGVLAVTSTPPMPATRRRTAFTPLRILVAEDNPVNCKVATCLIEKLGHYATVVHDGREALEAVARHSFDAILMDVQMPEMDGYEATSEIRERERGTGRHLPIIAVTAHAMSGDHQKCLDAGMDAYLSKPIDSEKLNELIDSLAGRFAAIA
jgi:CheY-like chemotaxis protein